MREIEIHASKDYRVTIGSGLLGSAGEAVKRLTRATNAVIVSDTHVWPLYGQIIADSLLEHGFQISHFIFPAGEPQKNGQTYLELLSFLAEHHITRSDCLIALGGGVVGDLAGFAAATYLRGVPYFQIPTSLLAMVDSSVGGKTAINLPCGKNLVGAFYQPTAVLCDIDTLRTLPETFFRDGCAEVIKYAVLFDPQLFAHLEDNGPAFDLESVISRCVELKRDVVIQDEFDTAERMKLNLGHTIGHAIECCSHYTVSHGQAVAAGMAIVARAAACLDRERIVRLLGQFGLPTETAYSAEQLTERALSDKKLMDGVIHMIVPSAIGDCRIVPIEASALRSFIQAGL